MQATVGRRSAWGKRDHSGGGLTGRSVAIVEAVTDAADGGDVLGRVGIRFDLAAESSDERRDDAEVAVILIAPDVVDELLARDDPTGVFHKLAQQLKLPERDVDLH